METKKLTQKDVVNWKGKIIDVPPAKDENGNVIPWNRPLNSGFRVVQRKTSEAFDAEIKNNLSEANK